MKRYAIWNKQDPIITPIGEVLTAQQWIDRYPVAGLDSITVICGAGEINGSFFGTLGQMVQIYEGQGADFSACESNEEKLMVIEAFEDTLNAPKNIVSNEELTATSLASIAASLEYQNLMSLPDEEVI
jgi:hypothetical protein